MSNVRVLVGVIGLALCLLLASLSSVTVLVS
ncbi:Uncharacterised protein [Klebsiella pneumoniae]|nr:Uncharacterised protein [Klebsiella pneumoniae]SVJ50680.1 Uncharacterised protein [Klebsiella pneumoniae]